MLDRLRGLLELETGGARRLRPMEGLRGVAVLLVFLQHYAVQSLIHVDLDGVALMLAQALRVIGNLGVVLFFILSGYLIHGTLLRRQPGFAAFMARRVERIYPAFLCVFALTAALHWLFATGQIPAEPAAAARLLLANLLLLPGVLAIEPLMAVAWTLSYEMAFYLVLGLIVPGLRMVRWPRAARIAFILGLAALVTGVCIFFPGDIGAFASPLPMLPFFAGMLLYELGETRLPAMPGWLALAVATADLLLDHRLVLLPLIREWCETIAMAMLCSAAFRGGNVAARAMSWTPLRWLGNMSYSYYLLHGLVVLTVFRGLAAWVGHGWPSATAFALLLPVFAASVAASLILFAMVERPLSLSRAGLRPAVLRASA
jgi:exopolysaccharide production protein ExoZ